MHFVGLDVSAKATSVCVVDDAGKVILEQKVPTDPADIIAILTSLGVSFGRIGIEAGPLSQWLVNAFTYRSLRPLPCSTRITIRVLSMSSTLSEMTSEARNPAP